ncbi:putative colanic acid biosynthesis acetyltransferase [Algibacter mikhailovii]|uniref:putative colanic acid biosynthesis acetyltransferase n=1 Tax=Algibacter mikhailovii TaxID=425498 RepID=UPI002494CD7B|nr:putative colanic acid biosynthesis acetyltransferase [Algibacter mikhailovii]
MQNLSLYKTPTHFRGRSKFTVQLWWIVHALLFKTSPQVLYGWRRFLLRCFGARIGKNVMIRPSAQLTYPWKIEIGDYSWIGDDVVLYSLGEIEIGSHAIISQRSYLCTGTHDHRKNDFPILSKKIIIESHCWLATDVFVSPGITIQKGTIVGARSSVFSNLPEMKICIGSPARVIKDREFE